MKPGVLRLMAQDADGLGIIASAVQDALVKPDDMKWDRRAKAFGMELNRFQWETARRRPPYFRSRAMLLFSSGQAVRSTPISPAEDAVLSLLDIRFEPATDAPAGEIFLVFAGDTLVRLQVECLEVTLLDTDAAWPTRRRPDHGKPAA